MFQALKPLLANGKLVIELSINKDESLTVMVTQKGEGPLATPLPLTATAEELDAEFANYITRYETARKSLAEQFATTEAILEAQKTASSTKATKALTAPATMVDKVKSAASDLDDEDDEGDGASGNVVPESTPAPASISSDNLFA